MKSITPMKKAKVLQTFGNWKSFSISIKLKKSIKARNIDREINFFPIQISQILNFPYFCIYLVLFLFQLFSAFFSFFQLFSAFFSFFQLFSKHNSQISYFFRSFHHKFLQSLLLLDKFSYNILTHTNLS